MKNGILASMFGFAAILVPASALLVPAATRATAAAVEGYHHGGRMMGGGHMLYGLVMMTAAIAVIIAIIVLLMRKTCRHRHGAHGGPSTPGGKSPQDILKERYARGEMTTKEFEERRKVLGD